MNYKRSELMEARRQIESALSKTVAAEKSFTNKENPDRYKSQITLARRRIEAFNISLALINKELACLEDREPSCLKGKADG